MRTFSEIVDVAVATVRCPQYLQYAVSACNAVIRELSAAYENNADDLVEVIIPEDMSAGWDTMNRRACSRTVKWTLPNDFDKVVAIRYGGKAPQGEIAPERRPGKVQELSPVYWYQSGETLVLSGAYGVISIAYRRLVPLFQYYKADKRMIRSFGTGEYHVAMSADVLEVVEEFDPHNIEHTVVKRRHVNWAIQKHSAVILEGLLSRLYNITGSMDRGGRHHQQYQADKQAIIRSSRPSLNGEH